MTSLNASSSHGGVAVAPLSPDLPRPNRERVSSFPAALRTAARRVAGILVSMLSCAAARLREAVIGESVYEMADDDDLAPMARERCVAKVHAALAEYVRSLHVGPGQTVSLRYEIRMVECENCGAFCSSRDECPRCGRVAIPSPHLPMIRHLARAGDRARRLYRRAEAKRKPAVFRVVKEASGG